MNNRKTIIVTVFITLTLVAIVFAISYAWLQKTLFGNKPISVTVGNLDLQLDETSSNGINLEAAFPAYDDEGKNTTPYTFSLINRSTIKVNYKLSLAVDEEALDSCTTTKGDACQLLDGRDIRYEISVNGKKEVGTLSDSYTIDYGIIDVGEANKIDYELKLWLNIGANNEAMGKVFLGKLKVLGAQSLGDYEPSNDNANAPVMDSNMIAVKHNGYNWVKTDSSNNWYNYDKGIWANAVTVKSDKLSTYQSAETNTEIAMEDIETMWVWIPRYSYTIGSEDGTHYYGKKGIYLDTLPTKALPGEISIKFITTEEKDEGNAKFLASNTPSNYRTPDAFTYDGKELAGIWVGKFETSSSDLSESNGGDNNASLDPMIKPNVTSWRNINMKIIHTVSTKVTASGNRYGFSSMESHAMKNDEWATVAYLSQSRFGKLGNESYKGAYKEVFINNNSSFITGCSAGSPNAPQSTNCDYTYDISMIEVAGEGGKGTGASTTGNIYGVYDMNGGAWEYVMANYNDTIFPSNGFSTKPDIKYYNKYTTTEMKTACNGGECLSHALSETQNWYNDPSGLVNEQYPWMIRGGDYNGGSSSGVFRSNRMYGDVRPYNSFRLVISK